MEERALYRAILAAPHDDAPRLVYADWLDEHADRFPEPLAKVERGRAEFIRLQCALARLAPNGWRAGERPPAPELVKRERRLIFQHGRKWRRAFPITLASAPFDRGFLRPYRALTTQQFLDPNPAAVPPVYQRVPPLPADSPARRYVADEDGPFATCPLWDVHLYAPGWLTYPTSDRGQYGGLLAEVARSPALARVGWLKVSFLRTPVLDFLRAGNFANVETLVLNAGPFPEVLEAVAENESFRSLRYVSLGADWWAWGGGHPALIRYFVLSDKLREANERHVPFGEMRAVLRSILRDTPVPPPPPPSPVPLPLRMPEWATQPVPSQTNSDFGIGRGLLAVVVLIGAMITLFSALAQRAQNPVTTPIMEFDYNSDRTKTPPAVYQPPRTYPLPGQVLPPTYTVPPPKPPRAEDRPDFVGPRRE